MNSAGYNSAVSTHQRLCGKELKKKRINEFILNVNDRWYMLPCELLAEPMSLLCLSFCFIPLKNYDKLFSNEKCLQDFKNAVNWKNIV